MKDLKDVALQAAEVAAKYLLENFRKDPELMMKRGTAKEVVTKYDEESDRMIVDMILEAFPDHNLLTEERGEIENGGEYLWIVDSLDGTGNFAVGNPFFGVSIGVMKGDELVLGIINAPFLQEVYVAEKGKGAFRNGLPIYVSEVDDLGQAYIASCGGGEPNNVRFEAILSRVHPLVKDLRKLGSAALECAWVASGRAEAYFTTKISPWDVAAGALLVQEAGGQVSDFSGKSWQLKESDYMFSNGNVHERLLGELGEVVV